MAPSKWSLPVFCALLLALAFTGGIHCVFDRSGLAPSPAPEQKYYSCTTDLMKCDKKNGPLQMNHTLAPVQGPPSPPIEFRVGVPFYSDQPGHRIRKIMPEKLRGARLVQTRMKDGPYTQPDYLTLYLHNKVEGVYVCFDSRASKYPDWLVGQGQYDRERDAKGSDLFVETSLKDPSTGQFIQFGVWRRKNLPPAGSPLVVQGNFSGFPQWPAKTTPLMYFVVVKPEEVTDFTTCVKERSVGNALCYDNEAPARNDAENRCRKAAYSESGAGWVDGDGLSPYNWECMNTQCFDNTSCTDDARQTYSLKNRSYLQSSVIRFVPPSTAELNLLDHVVTTPVSGELHFDYVYEQDHMKELIIHSMVLDLADFSVPDAGRFTDVVVALLDSSKASCRDPAPQPVVTPCSHYSIDSNGFQCSEAAVNEGVPLFFATRNQGPVDIHIDHAGRAFQFGGTLQSTVLLDGEEHEVLVDVSLLGYFDNLAPKARADLESDTYVECIDEVNERTVLLSAAGSFDAYDSIPPSAYRWYEDYSQVTETDWTTGTSQVTIPAASLSYGIHTFTLLVTDSYGTAGSDEIDVEVGDSTPPQLTVPPDIVALLTPPEGPPLTVASLGEAYATDLCAPDHVELNNDAPQDLAFPAGETVVTWTAEDGRGNIATAIQKVIVAVLEEPLYPDLKNLTQGVISSVNQARTSLEACRSGEPCSVDLSSSIMLLERMAEAMETIPPDEGQEDLHRSILDFLRGAAENLETARELVESFLENPEAAGALDEAAALLDEAMGILERARENLEALGPEPPDGPVDNVTKITVGGAEAGEEVEAEVDTERFAELELRLSRRTPEEMEAGLYVCLEAPEILPGFMWARPGDDRVPLPGGSYIQLFRSPQGYLDDAAQAIYSRGALTPQEEDVVFRVGTQGLGGLALEFTSWYLPDDFPLDEEALERLQKVRVLFE